MKTIDDIKEIKFPIHATNPHDGVLVPVELQELIPFEVKRIFYVQGASSPAKKGKHAHIKTNQVLVCIKGTIECICKDRFGGEISIILSDSTTGIHIPEMIWDEQIYSSKESILLSFCSTSYDRRDYIEDWEDFRKCP